MRQDDREDDGFDDVDPWPTDEEMEASWAAHGPKLPPLSATRDLRYIPPIDLKDPYGKAKRARELRELYGIGEDEEVEKKKPRNPLMRRRY